jgi:hypothetical protein
MFVFIVPLRSPETCADWKKVSLLCNQTLKSLIGQTSDRYRILLVCNSPPLNLIEDEHIIVVQENFAVPTVWEDRFGDIYRKVKRGMLEIRRLQLIQEDSSSFVMRVDADDLVSNQLVSFAEKHPNRDGWYFLTGYVHQIGTNHLFLRPRFTTVSGTSHIFKCGYSDLPESMDTPSSEWLETVWQHLNVNKLLEPRGLKLSPLPFPGAVYQLNEHNSSSTHLKNNRFSTPKSILWQMLFKQQLTQKAIGEFGFSTHSTDVSTSRKFSSTALRSVNPNH